MSFGIQGDKNGGSVERPTINGSVCGGGTTSSAPRSSSPSSQSNSSVPSALVIQESQSGFCRVDGTVDSNNEGFTGAGFANTNNAQGAAVVWALESYNSRRQSLTIRFANGRCRFGTRQ